MNKRFPFVLVAILVAFGTFALLNVTLTAQAASSAGLDEVVLNTASEITMTNFVYLPVVARWETHDPLYDCEVELQAAGIFSFRCRRGVPDPLVFEAFEAGLNWPGRFTEIVHPSCGQLENGVWRVPDGFMAPPVFHGEETSSVFAFRAKNLADVSRPAVLDVSYKYDGKWLRIEPISVKIPTEDLWLSPDRLRFEFSEGALAEYRVPNLWNSTSTTLTYMLVDEPEWVDFWPGHRMGELSPKKGRSFPVWVYPQGMEPGLYQTYVWIWFWPSSTSAPVGFEGMTHNERVTLATDTSLDYTKLYVEMTITPAE